MFAFSLGEKKGIPNNVATTANRFLCSMAWWWLFYLDPERPHGSRFKRACIVQGNNLLEAVQDAHYYSCHISGELEAVRWPDAALEPMAGWVNRQLSEEEVARFEAAIRDHQHRSSQKHDPS